ncbi:MAG: ATP-binding protein [Candidatus Limnocylindria bacterium]
MVRCQACGEENPDRARFCLACGATIAAAPGVLRAARKTVTVLFADVSGSTALGERLDPESLRGVMSRYFDMARAVMERHGGTVEKFIGDAVMAVFGIPMLHEDDALRAVRAAAALRTSVAALGAELLAERGVEFAVRIGVNTGEVVVGAPSPSQTLVTGDAVNVAARLEQAAPPGEILLGPATYRLVRDAVLVEAVPPLWLKGKSEPIPARRLVSVDPTAAGHARRIDAPLVGREREVALLSQALDRAIADEAAYLFTVLGPPGVGKSRLVSEFLALQVGRATVHRGRCLPYGDGATYWPLREVIFDAAGIGEESAPEEALASVTELVAAAERARSGSPEEIQQRRDSAASEARLTGRQSPERPGRMAELLAGAIGLGDRSGAPQEVAWAFRKLIEGLARERPLVLLFDDIQWAEPTFLDLLEHIADWSRSAPILLICLARADLLEERPSWGGGKMNATTILLEPLSEEQSRELVRELLGHAGIGIELTERIAGAAEGNPLFVEELIAMLVDDGLLRRTADGWATSGDVSSLLIPPTVSALLAARLDRLSEPERDLIGRAAVVGKVFEEAAVAELSAADVRPTVQRHLLALVRKELIRPDRSSPDDDVYRFRHLLIRDAAYAALSKELRAELHERFADWLVAAADGSAQYDEIVAYHLEQAYLHRAELNPSHPGAATLRERASAMLADLGRRALGRGDFRSARGLLDRAVAVLADGDARRSDLLIMLGEAEYFVGNLGTAERRLGDAMEIAQARADPRGAMRARIQLENVRSMRDAGYHWADFQALLDDAEGIFEASGDTGGLARVWDLRSELALVGCQWEATADACRRAYTYALQSGEEQIAHRAMIGLANAAFHGPSPVADALVTVRGVIESDPARLRFRPMLPLLGHLLVMDGRVEEGLERIGQGRAALLELGNRLFHAATAMTTGAALLLADRPEPAIAEMRAAVDELTAMGEKGMLSTLAGQLALALARSGRLPEADALVETSRSSATAGDIASQIVWREAEAVTSATRGRGAEATRLVEEAIEYALRGDDLDQQADAFVVLAEVRAAATDPQGAAEAGRRALELYERKGNRTAAARLRRSMAAQTAKLEPA